MRWQRTTPDGTTLLPWATGKPMAWEVTVPDTYADSHIDKTVVKPGAAADTASGQATNMGFESATGWYRPNPPKIHHHLFLLHSKADIDFAKIM